MDAREKLDGLDNIGFAEENGDGLDLLNGNLGGTHLRGLHILDTLGSHGDFLQLDAVEQFEMIGAVGIEEEMLGNRGVSDIGDGEVDRVAFQGQGETAVGIGNGAFFRVAVKNGNADKSFTCFLVGDSATDSEGLGGK